MSASERRVLQAQNSDKQKAYISLGVRFSIIIVSVLWTTITVVSYFYMNSQLNHSIERLKNTGNMLTHFVARISPDAVLSYDFDTMDRYVQDINKQEDVIYAVIFGTNGLNITSYLDSSDPLIQQYSTQLAAGNINEIVKKLDQSDSVLALRAPILSQGEKIGTIGIGLSKQRVLAEHNALRNQIIIGSTLLFILLSGIIVIALRHVAIRPLINLKKGLHSVADGDLDHKINILNNDEIGDLTKSFNKMVDKLNETISEKKFAEDKTEELKILRDQAVQANEAKNNFLANMSHELRTPLNAIIGYSEILIEDFKETETAEDLDRIYKSAIHLLAIISEILDLSKIDAGKIEKHETSFEISALLKDLEKTVQPMLLSNNNSLAVDCSKDIGFIHTDLTKLRQVLLNLLSNACKFTHEGAITLVAELHTQNNIDYILFKVKDSGIGILPHDLDKIFEPFVQADNSATRKYGGTGLGLAICQKITNMLGGTIDVFSQPDRGSTFVLELPRGEISDELNLVEDNPRMKNLKLA